MAKVLIIEDDDSLREIYRREFELEGFIAETAIDGQQGVEKMVSSSPDLVILDLYMPTMSGFDVLKTVKTNPKLKEIPIIVLTNINPDSQDLLKNWGVKDFLFKGDNTLKQVVERSRIILKEQMKREIK